MLKEQNTIPKSNPPKKIKILRRPKVEEKSGLARSTLYLLVKSGKFPKPINLGPRSVGWIESEIDEWLALRMAERG